MKRGPRLPQPPGRQSGCSRFGPPQPSCFEQTIPSSFSSATRVPAVFCSWAASTTQPNEMKLNRVCVYCGSNCGSHPAYAEAARELGTTIARRGLGLVYGGGG